MRGKVLTFNIVHLLVNKRRIYKNAPHTQFQERRLLMQSGQLYNFFSCCNGTLCLYRPVLSSPGCIMRTDDAARSTLLTLMTMSTLRTKTVMLNQAQLVPPICHLHIRRYVLVLTTFSSVFANRTHLKRFPKQISVCIPFLSGIIYMSSL